MPSFESVWQNFGPTPFNWSKDPKESICVFLEFLIGVLGDVRDGELARYYGLYFDQAALWQAAYANCRTSRERFREVMSHHCIKLSEVL